MYVLCTMVQCSYTLSPHRSRRTDAATLCPWRCSQLLAGEAGMVACGSQLTVSHVVQDIKRAPSARRQRDLLQKVFAMCALSEERRREEGIDVSVALRSFDVLLPAVLLIDGLPRAWSMQLASSYRAGIRCSTRCHMGRLVNTFEIVAPGGVAIVI